jgi:hypothetical protein
MASADDLRRLALALPGAVAYPHFDRTAFKVARTFVTLAPDGKSANFKFTPEEQEFKCMLAPDIFAPVPGGWGRMGFTCAQLDAMTEADLRAALAMAHAHAVKTKKARRR